MPHSEILGSQLACSSPRLIAAYHVLHRLTVPRHPPCALNCLISKACKSTTVLFPDTITHSRSPSIVKERNQCLQDGVERGRPVSVFRLTRLASGSYSTLQKGGDPAAGSPTATLLRLRPSHRICLRPLPPEGWITDFGHSRLPWRDGRCVQGPGTYSPRRG